MSGPLFSNVILPASRFPLKCSDLCILDVHLLLGLGLKVKGDFGKDSRLLPLIFSTCNNDIEILNCKDGSVVSVLALDGLVAARWFLPFSLFRRFPTRAIPEDIPSAEEDKFGIITVDSGNVIAIYGHEGLGVVTHDSPISGISTSYLRVSDGNSSVTRLAIVSIDVGGTIKRWFPFCGPLSVEVYKPLDRRVSAVSDTNLLVEYRNYGYACNAYECNEYADDETTAREMRRDGLSGNHRQTGGMDAHYGQLFELNKLLVIGYTDGSVAVVNLEKMSIHALVNSDHYGMNGKAPIRAIATFVDSQGDFVVSVFDGHLRFYRMSGPCDPNEPPNGDQNGQNLHNEHNDRPVEPTSHFSLRLTQSVAIRYIKPDPNNRDILLLSTTTNRLIFFNYKTNKAIVFIGVPAGRLYLYHYAIGSDVYFNVISMDVHMVCIDPFRVCKLYSRMVTDSDFGILSSSFLHPACIFSGSRDGTLRIFDVGVEMGGACTREINGTVADFYGPAANSDTKELWNTEWNGNLEDGQDGPPGDGDASREENAPKKSHHSDPLSPGWETLETFRVDVELPPKGIRTLKSGIRALVHHPRIPSIVAVGCVDGSVHLIFIEAENTSLYHILFCAKFERPVNQLVWLLTDRVDEETEVDYKRLKSSLLERIWKSIESARYASVLVMQSGEDVRWVELSRSMRGCNATVAKRNGDQREPVNSIPPGGKIIHTDGYMEYASSPGCAKLALVFSIKWPIHNDSTTGQSAGAPEGSMEPTDSHTDVKSPLHPPESYIDENMETVTNFCNVSDCLALLYYSPGSMYLHIFSRLEDSFTLVCPVLRIPVNGVPTSVSISSKQYNQIYRHQASGYEMLYSRYSRASLDQSLCINALQEFIAIGTNTGYVYASSLLYLYNASILSSCDSSVQVLRTTSRGHTSPNGLPSSLHTLHSGHHASHSGELTIYGITGHKIGMSIDVLKFAVLWKRYDMKVNFVNQNRCMCTDDCVFALAVGVVDFGVKVYKISNRHSEGPGMDILPIFESRRDYDSIIWAEQALPGLTRLLVGSGKSLISTSFSYAFCSRDGHNGQSVDLESLLGLLNDDDSVLDLLLAALSRKTIDAHYELLMGGSIETIMDSVDHRMEHQLAIKVLLEVCMHGKEQIVECAREFLVSRIVPETFLDYFNGLFLIYQDISGSGQVESEKSKICAMGGVYLATLLVLLDDVLGALEVLAGGFYLELILFCKALSLPVEETLSRAAEMVSNEVVAALLFVLSGSLERAKEALHRLSGKEEISQDTKNRIECCLMAMGAECDASRM